MYNFGVTLIRNSNLGLVNSYAIFKVKQNLTIVVSQHELPDCIISDYIAHFCGHFWDDLMSLLDRALIFTMVLHPQTNGIAEVTNYTMKQPL